MKKSRGFTLIELLAVIIILAGIALITFPLLLNQIKNSENQIDEATKKLVVSATKLYIDDNLNDYPLTSGNTYCIPFTDLISSNYLQKGILEASEVDTSNKTVKVTVTDDYSYEMVNDDACTSYISKTCNLVNDTEPSGISYGDEYSCNPGDGVRRTFYVLEDGDNTTLTKGTTGTTGLGEVSLIMNQDIDDTLVKWCKTASENTCGGNPADGAKEALATKTISWTDVNVNLPTANQIAIAGGDTGWTDSYVSGQILVSWLSTSRGYWTSSIDTDSIYYSWRVTTNRTLNTYSVEGSVAIRPVITINKEQLGS